MKKQGMKIFLTRLSFLHLTYLFLVKKGKGNPIFYMVYPNILHFLVTLNDVLSLN